MKHIFFGTDKDKIKHVYQDFIESDEVIYDEGSIGKEDFTDVEVIFSTWNMPILKEEEITFIFPKLKAVFYAAGTVKYFVEPYHNLGVKVYNADKVNAIPVAEFTVSQIQLALKGYFQSQQLYRNFQFRKARQIAEFHHGAYKAKVGLIGFGNIGKLVAQRLQHLDVEILVNDIFLNEEILKKYAVEESTLENIFQECDVISNHLPNIPSTIEILDYNLFHSMKPYATFINTARGQQISEKGLRKALKECKTRCASLDVLTHEPILPWNPLFGLSNVFITPHIAGSLNLEERRMGEAMMEAYNSFIKGEKSIYEVETDKLITSA